MRRLRVTPAHRATVLIAQVVVSVVQAAVGIVAFFAMMALGGAFGPAEALPGPLATIGEHTPLGDAIESMVAGWHGANPPDQPSRRHGRYHRGRR
jgi:ABC-2 type transport system permease protein